MLVSIFFKDKKDFTCKYPVLHWPFEEKEWFYKSAISRADLKNFFIPETIYLGEDAFYNEEMVRCPLCCLF